MRQGALDQLTFEEQKIHKEGGIKCMLKNSDLNVKELREALRKIDEAA